MRINLNNFLKGKFAINCTTSEDADKLFEVLREKNIKWANKLPLDNTNWSRYKIAMCYLCKNGRLKYGHMSYVTCSYVDFKVMII